MNYWRHMVWSQITNIAIYFTAVASKGVVRNSA
jgi:hypothetical protein